LINFVLIIGSIIELRRLEKEEERRAREKILQKLEEDKVLFPSHSQEYPMFC
jgi:hypothetical protein